MKRLLAVAFAMIGFSSAYALTASDVLMYVEKDLGGKEISLMRDMPEGIQTAYKNEMKDIYGMVSEAYDADAGTSLTRAQLRDLIAPFYTKYNTLKKDQQNYLKTKTSQYLITDAEKKRITDEILMYQVPIVDFIEKALDASYQNYREEDHFTITVKNTLIDVTIQAPKITSRTNIDQNRTAIDFELLFDATIKDSSTVNMTGKISLEAIISESMVYLKIPSLDVQTKWDGALKATIDSMVNEVKKIIEKVGGRYIAIPIENGTQMNSVAQIKKQLETWKKNPVLMPYKRIAENNFMMDINEEQFTELGLSEVETYTFWENANIELQLGNDSSKVGICPKESLGKLTSDSIVAGEEVCFYAKRTGKSPLQLKLFINNPSEGLIDIMINAFSKDFTAHIAAQGTDTSIVWENGNLNSVFKDGTDIYAAQGPLTTRNGDITIKKNNITIGNIGWSQSYLTGYANWNLQLWDEYNTYIEGKTGMTRTYETNFIDIPKNTIDASELEPDYGYNETSYTYDDSTDEAYENDYNENLVGVLSSKDLRQLLLKNHVKSFGESSIALVVFTDIECPFCQKYEKTLTQDLPKLADYELHIKHYPLPFHDNAKTWAVEAECIANGLGEDAFFSYLDERMITGVSDADLVYNFGISKDSMKQCKKSGTIQNIIQRDAVFAEKYNTAGTPSTVVVNKKTGDYAIVQGAQSAEAVLAVIQSVQ